MADDDRNADQAYESPLTKITTGALLGVGALALVACVLYALWWLWMNWAP